MIRKFSFILTIGFVVIGCENNEPDIDTVYPVIDTTVGTSFPVQCSTVKRGEAFTFKANFSDNKQLGGYSLDIHHNFDHHTHSTEVSNCQTDPVKVPKSPFLFIKSFEIPGNVNRYEASQKIDVPADIDPGDYHFMVRLTDQEGWQTIRGISFKII